MVQSSVEANAAQGARCELYSQTLAAALIEIAGRTGKFQMVDSIHSKYSSRPERLGNVCLAQFACSYVPSCQPSEKIMFENGVSEKVGCIQQFGTDGY